MLSLRQLRPTIKMLSLTIIPNRTKIGSMVPRQSKILNKLVFGKIKGKRNWYGQSDGPKPTTPKSLSSTHNQNRNAPRRVNVLNKLFMKNITDLMATGELSDVILGHGVEVTRVNICQSYHNVNVYWQATGTQKDETVESKLHRIAGTLRHELSQLRLMGEVPRITFVKDKHFSLLSEVDALLQKADFGEDYERGLNQGQTLKKNFAPEYRTVQGTGDDIKSTVPPMRHDVLGLDQSQIMERIKKSMNQTRQAWQHYESQSHYSSTESSNTMENVQQQIDEQSKRETQLQQFLEKRRIEKKLRPERPFDVKELVLDELERTRRNNEWHDDFDDEKDFIEEDVDEKFK